MLSIGYPGNYYFLAKHQEVRHRCIRWVGITPYKSGAIVIISPAPAPAVSMLVFTLAFARIFRLTCDAPDFSDRCGVSICAFVQYNNIIGYLVSGADACVRYLIEAPKIADKPSRTMCIASHSQQNVRILAHKYARITPTFRVPAMHALSPTENKTTAHTGCDIKYNL